MRLLIKRNINPYGVEYLENVAAPEMKRIGNLDKHVSLPVQSQMKACLLLDDGTVNYYLNPNNWLQKEDGTPSILDGTDGQVMIELPEYWWLDTVRNGVYRIQISDVEEIGFTYCPKMYVSAFEAALHRPTLKLSSVINTSVDYRGGNNNATWDSEERSLLGKPATSINLTNFRTYAKNRGDGWFCNMFEVQSTLWRFYMVEYANRNSQADFNPNLTPEGYKQGGLGAGVTNATFVNWNNYNNYNPVHNCGYSLSLGSNTGIVPLSFSDFGGSALNTNVISYRGVENIFGHIWKYTDGLLFATDGDGVRTIWLPEDYNYTSVIGDNYKMKGVLPATVGYTRNVFLKELSFLPNSVTGGSATTYFCDSFHRNNATLAAFLFGGSGINDADAGVGSVASDISPANANDRVGSRLCFYKHY